MEVTAVFSVADKIGMSDYRKYVCFNTVITQSHELHKG